MQNAKVIDADGHVQDRDADIRACMEEPFCRRQGPLVAKDNGIAVCTVSSGSTSRTCRRA